jgi:hypothetical protein
MRTREELRVIRCTECERPWGVILPRSRDETDEVRAQLALEEAWRSHAREWEIDPDTLPAPESRITSVVFMSEADWKWLEEIGYETNADGGTWCEIEWLDAPAWWINRRRRFALRWDCCSVDSVRMKAPV